MNNNVRVPLWAPNNQTPMSSAFRVNPGQAVILTATGFEDLAAKGDDGDFDTEQMACVERVIMEFSQEAWDFATKRCGWVIDLTRRLSEEVGAEAVSVGDCCWTMSASRNVGVIGLPGLYRLVLNDDTAIGAVQVYAEVVGIDQVKPDSLFFGSE